MTTIIINEKYKIEVDQYNFTALVRVYGKDKKGNAVERGKLIGHYTTLDRALVAISHLMTVDERETYSISEYIAQSIESSKTIRNSLKLKVKDLEEIK